MGLSVLVVDDHASLRRLVETVVADDSRFDRVLTAASVTEALHLAESERPDVVLLDADLRGVDGMAAIGPLKQRLEGAPVVVFSSAPYASARSARAAGADGFVEKGTDLDLLLDLLHELVAARDLVDLRQPAATTRRKPTT